jgi:AcrR family transcriptional regulator
MSVKRGRAEKAKRTQEGLVRHARKVFAKKGYADASLGEIVKKAGVTKGALYHHFPDKEQLYQAVVEDVEHQLVATIKQAAEPHDDAWLRLSTMCTAYLDHCLNQDVQRILVLDAPVVLGWKKWCDIDKKYASGTIADSLGEAMRAGVLDKQPTEPLAQLILGALSTAARVIASAPDPTDARELVGGSIDRLLAGLRTAPP